MTDKAAARQRRRDERAAKRQSRIDAMNARMDSASARLETFSERSQAQEEKHRQRGEEIKVEREARRAQSAAEKDALKTRHAERKAALSEKRDRHPIQYMTRLGAHFVNKGEYSSGRVKKSIAGATAEFESGTETKRVTGTRVLTGAVLLGPVGAIAGGALRKNKTKCYVTITFADGDNVIVELPIKDEPKARKFVATVNAASAYYANRD